MSWIAQMMGGIVLVTFASSILFVLYSILMRAIQSVVRWFYWRNH